MESKHNWRKALQQRITNLSNKTKKDQLIVERLIQILKPFSKVLTYSALPDEPDISILPKVLKDIDFYYPRVNTSTLTLEFIYPNHFIKGAFGVLEPVGQKTLSPSSLDWLLLPALGYSASGYRLGRGGGYYDRTLIGLQEKKIIGVSYSDCICIDFTPEPHDIRVGRIITETDSFFLLDEN